MIPGRALTLVAGQAGAALGFGVTAFALGSWALASTHQSSSYTLLVSASALPGVLLAPVAGVVAERFAPARVLLWANGCALSSTFTLLALVLGGHPPGWHLPLLLVVSGIGFGLQWPAWGKALTGLAPREQLDTAAALLQLGTVAQYVLAPAVAGSLVGLVGTAGLLGVDAALLMLAMASALGIHGTPTTQARTTLAAGVFEAWEFLRAHPGLLTLQMFFCASYFFGGVSVALSTPLLLSITDPRSAGLCLSLSGAGMVLGVGGALLLGRRPRPGRMVLFIEALCGICLGAVGLFPSMVGVTLSSTLFLALTGVSNATAQALWQHSVPLHLQVRVFALRRMIAWGALPLGYVVAGYAADAVASFSSPTDGLAGVFLIAGVGKATVSLAFWRSKVATL